AKVFKCPSDRSLASIRGSFYPRARSVMMNSYMGFQPGQPQPDGDPYAYVMEDWLASHPPVETGFVFIDAHEDSMATGFFLVSLPFVSAWNHFPGSRHNGAATLSFSDGHAICHKWRDPRT